jgi:hypothetical protein
MNQIELYSIPTNVPPYSVFVCDYFGNNCVFVAQIITSVPPTYTINVPPQFDLAPAVTLKIIDGVGCEISKQFVCGQSSADKICKCENLFNQNIYVFYDASTLDPATASGASQSVRSWFTGATATSGFTGNLYEAMIGKNSNNGENWMWWSTYPYLGSLTGGTLSDGFTQVNAFGVDVNDYVVGTEKKSSFCQATPTFACRPKLNSFNDSTSGGTIYQNINRGEDFITGLSLSGSNIMGVPFDHNDLNGADTGLYGNFSGKDSNYTVICVIDEADGIVGMYTSVKNLTADTLNDGMFQLIQSASLADAFTGTSLTAPYQPSTRFTSEYEGFLKVWNDIKSLNGTFNGLVYPVIGANVNSGFNFIHHVLAATEGIPQSALYFSNKYDRNGQTWPHINPDLNALNPVAYTFAGLETINYYSGLTATTTYSSLPNIFQNGSGLKNFGWFTDPTVSAFTQTVVAETLDNFVVRVSAGTDCKYIISDPNLNLNKIYYFDTSSSNGIKGCYQVTEKNTVYSTNFVSPALFGNYDYCFQCNGTYTPARPTNFRSSNSIAFGYNNGNVRYINDMWTSSTFFSVLNYQGVTFIRYPGGNATYWDWENNNYATLTEYPNLPYRFYGLNPRPSMDLDVRATALTTYNLNNLWSLNDYFRGIQNQMDYLFSAQSLGLNIDYIEIGQEYYLNPGATSAPDNTGFITRFPISTTPPYNQYALEKIDWIYSARTNFPFAKIAILGSIEDNGPYPNSRINLWNKRLIQVFQDATYNPNFIYPDAITFHSYTFTTSTDFANINTWIQTSVELEYQNLTTTIDNFKTLWNLMSNLEFWITEFGVTDSYDEISGSWAHGLYLISMLFKILEINDVTIIMSNSLSSGRDYGMLFDRKYIFGAPNTADKFDLSAGGLVLGMFNRSLNDSTGFDVIDFSSVSTGLYGKIFTGGTSNYLLYSNTTENPFTLDLSSLLNGYTINYYLIYDALPTLYVNKKDPSTLIKEFPNITSGYTISNIYSITSPAFSVSYIEFT